MLESHMSAQLVCVCVCVCVCVALLPNVLNEQIMLIGFIIKLWVPISAEPATLILFFICAQLPFPFLLALILNLYHFS